MAIVTETTLTPRITRAARALLDWTSYDLANQAGVSPATVHRFEGGENVRAKSKTALIAALTSAGVILTTGKTITVSIPANDNPDRKDCA